MNSFQVDHTDTYYLNIFSTQWAILYQSNNYDLDHNYYNRLNYIMYMYCSFMKTALESGLCWQRGAQCQMWSHKSILTLISLIGFFYNTLHYYTCTLYHEDIQKLRAGDQITPCNSGRRIYVNLTTRVMIVCLSSGSAVQFLTIIIRQKY